LILSSSIKGKSARNTPIARENIMRQHNAYTLNDWPRRKNGELIFQNTNEAFYYANIVDDRVAAYHYLEKWRKNTLQDMEALKKENR